MNTYIDEILKQKNKLFSNSTDTFNMYLIKRDFENEDNTIFVVLPNLFEAQKYYDGLTQICDEDNVLFFPVDQILTRMMALGSHEFQSERLYTINKLLTKNKFIVITTLDGITLRQLSVSDYINSKLILEKNQTYQREELINFLVNSGYTNSYIVETPGTFSVRGSIIDIYTRDFDNPYRIDFFDDEIESIKIFDVSTQRSFGTVNKLEILPLNELFFTSQMKEKAIKNIEKHQAKFTLSSREKNKLSEDLEKISSRRLLSSLTMYIPFFNKEETTILDFVTNKKIYVIDEYKMHINETQKLDDLNTFKVTMDGEFFLSFNDTVDYKKQIKLADFNIDNLGKNSNNTAYNLNVKETNKYNNNLPLLYYDLVNTYRGFKIYLDITQSKDRLLLIEYFKKNNFFEYEITNQEYIGSFAINNVNEVYISDDDIFAVKHKKTVKYRSVLNQSSKISNIEELNIGDYVVHYEFGIAKYLGLKTTSLTGITRDYLYLMYKDDESLYVPMEQIDLILKYSSNDGIVPKLSKIGSKQWQNTKKAVKQKIKDLSDRLINLYAARKEAHGFGFSNDNEIQAEFEQGFKYTLTKDQEKSINEVKRLMNMPKPMDLLLIGDVGFGKTEVALRAAFKAVLDSKQVLYLVPTTVLARQHYYTFKDRFEKFGASVELLSRFVSKKRQTETISKLKKGFVDVVIGTHRLLSKDVIFKDLGLLIIDEEQRFGVIHKERIKEIKVNVDTLTLSATPIPRTLQMSMMGLKDLTTIETPPQNRYPVQTYVVPREDALIKEVIRREISRGGQIFYLYNKVEDMELIVLKIQKLVPEAKIIYAHGQMSKVQLEDTISDFINHEYDILVSTTIIETGIDIPNTNTLIIHDADRLGLSQLYQIRGRVGRSDRIAYAYLMYDKFKDLNDDAYKRLRTLEDFTELGSGYKIALKDLAIRGAGDILGKEQSGFIDSVGLEMYLQLLDEVINDKEELKTIDEYPENFVNKTVSKEYVSNDAIRIEIHKKISKINSTNDINDLKDELEDRFGRLDFDLILYMYEKLFKKLLNKMGIYKVLNGKKEIKLIISKEKSDDINGEKLFHTANKFKLPVKLGYLKNEINITIEIEKTKEHFLYIVVQFIEEYYKENTDA